MKRHPKEGITMKGGVHISRVHSSHEDDYMMIEFVDRKSGIQFVQAKISMEDMMYALTGRYMSDMEFKINGVELVGMTQEHKEEMVFLPDDGPSYSDREGRTEFFRKILKKHEIDGWKGYAGDLGNHHRGGRRDEVNGVKGAHYKVSFHRFVPDTDDDGK